MTGRDLTSLVLITTSRRGARPSELTRLCTSVRQFSADSTGTKVSHHVLMQGATGEDRDVDPVLSSPDCHVHYIGEFISLSHARNLLLDKIFVSGCLENAVVCFPDDDAWYPDQTLLNIVRRFEQTPLLDLWVCRSGPSPKWANSQELVPLRVQPLLSNGTSNTIFLRGSLVRSIGFFDENLGLGTPAKSGEDTDYALRAFQQARCSVFLDSVVIGHRAFDQRDRIVYFSGALFAIARHASRVAGGLVALGRKCFIGCLWCVIGQMPLSELAKSLWKAMTILRTKRL